jgi:cyclic nucleotide-binding protein
MATKRPDASFSLLTGDHIDALPFKAGSVIFREGDEARELFMIKSGQVRIQTGNRTVTELGPESIFGEMADRQRAAQRQRDRGNRHRAGARIRKAVLVSGEPNPSFCPQRNARFGRTVAKNQQDVWLNWSQRRLKSIVQRSA